MPVLLVEPWCRLQDVCVYLLGRQSKIEKEIFHFLVHSSNCPGLAQDKARSPEHHLDLTREWHGPLVLGPSFAAFQAHQQAHELEAELVLQNGI